MIIFLYGPDSYRRLEKKRQIIAEFLKKYNADGVREFDFSSEDDCLAYHVLARSRGLFATSFLAVIEQPFEDGSANAKVIKEALERKDITLLITTDEARIPKAFSFLTKKPAHAQEFKPLSGSEWTVFIQAHARGLGITVPESALTLLARSYAGDSWGMVRELERQYSAGKTTIDKKDIEETVPSVSLDFWQTMNGMKSTDVHKRLGTLEHIFASGEPAPKVFNILAASWKEKVPRMAELDLKIKTGKLDYEEALLDLAIN